MPDTAGPTTTEIRASMERAFGALALAPGHRTEDAVVRGRPALWVLPNTVTEAGSGTGAILHLHGGGYRAGSPRAALGLTSQLAADTGLAVLSLAYRLAPEHPFPGAVHDALAAYQWLLELYGDPGRIAVVGESSGGGLAIATLLAARDAGLRQPAAAVALSPWLDVTNTADSFQRFAESDKIFNPRRSAESATAYVADGDPRDPLVSPVYAELAGLAPILIHVADDEVLVDDAVTLAGRVERAGSQVRLEQWPGAVHMWHVYCGELPTARDAVADVARFLTGHLDR